MTMPRDCCRGISRWSKPSFSSRMRIAIADTLNFSAKGRTKSCNAGEAMLSR